MPATRNPSSKSPMFSGLHLELDLPLTGIIGLEDRISMPNFNGPFCEADHRGNQASHFEHHYASQVALRRLCANLHNTINDCKELKYPSLSIIS